MVSKLTHCSQKKRKKCRGLLKNVFAWDPVSVLIDEPVQKN